MYLSKLEIVGFKTFAQKTLFKLADGISGLVGPNGCGKTNIVDAIRWALGEQRPSVLRSDTMENLIFNGNASRKPLGMAEVSLTVQNNKKILPIEFEEVVITRRLFRSGESQYLINNAQCRLRDIINLFMDTGMGADSYSVIELKMVETILSGRAEERRRLLEEAAGVNKYKLRRKEAARRLDTVQSDLVRVKDIHLEIQKNVSSLQRQAQKTQRYNKLLTQLKELEIKQFEHDYFTAIQNLEDLCNQYQDIKKENSLQVAALEESSQVLNEIRTKLAELELNYEHAAAEENAKTSSIASLNKDLAVASEKIQSKLTAQERIAADKKEKLAIIETLSATKANAEENLEVLNQERSKLKGELLEAVSLRDEAYSEFLTRQDALRSSSNELNNLQNQIKSANSASQKLENQKRTIEQRIDSTLRSITAIENGNSDIENKISRHKTDISSLENTLEKAVKELENARNRQTVLMNEIEASQNSISEQKNLLSQKTAAYEFLKNLTDSSDTVKHLINSKNWTYSGERIPLAESIGADEDLRIAVGAALGDLSRSFIVDTREDATSGILALTGSGKGKAVFICRSMIPDAAEPGELPQHTNVRGWLSELVRCDDKIRNFLRLTFNRTVIVDNWETAWTVVSDGVADCAVTLDGEYVSSDGAIRGGSAVKSEGIFVGKKERIGKLEKECSEIRTKLSNLELHYTELKREQSSINISQLSASVQKAQNAKHDAEQRLQQLLSKRDSDAGMIKLHNDNIIQLRSEKASLEAEIASIAAQIEQLETQSKKLRCDYEEQRSYLLDAENLYNQRKEEAREIEMKLVRCDADISNLKREIERIGNQYDFEVGKIKSFDAEISNNSKLIADFKEAAERLSIEIEKANQELKELTSNRQYLHSQVVSLQEQSTQYAQALEEKRKQLEKTINALHQKELKINETSLIASAAASAARSQHEIELETKEIVLDTEFSSEANKAEIHKLKEKLAQLGNVNFMALEEFETQSQRLQFYSAQLNDLVESEKTLQETITEINQTAEKQFLDTFNQINENFKNLFIKLFGEESYAELRLVEDEPLEADIEIIAKPPGKKPHAIESLSAGEKTLVAIALLFAIYLVKPSPFCILDEVDAPLDDTNIDRFLNLISDFANNTQFLVVTHNKRTMEAAGTLYGVTMEEEGVSKVVSVSFKQQNVPQL